MKKYPVIYKGKEYEVRWTQDEWGEQYLVAYEVKKVWKIKYSVEVYRMLHADINSHLRRYAAIEEMSDYYIEQVKYLFKMMEAENQNKQMKQVQEQSLKEWDGVIDVN